jgi:parallel beta helix pectate lyase-like protein
MNVQKFRSLGLIAAVSVTAMAYAAEDHKSQNDPASLAPALERAAADLAMGHCDTARDVFRKIAMEPTTTPFVRGLAMLGAGEAALAGNKTAAAVNIWRKLADDETLARAHRDTARRHIEASQRRARGLSAYDPTAHREQFSPVSRAGVTFHVAADGTGANDGSMAKPFGSLNQARDAIRALNQSSGGKLPEGGFRVMVHGGVHGMRATFQLTAEDSGTASSPIVYQATAGATPIFDGGGRIDAWKPVSDAALRAKFDPAVRNRVLEANLKSLGVEDLGHPTAARLRPELFCNNVPQTLARWPNEGFALTGAILGTETFKIWNSIPGCKDGKFRFIEDRPARWTDEPDAHLYGYWFWDWFEEYQEVASIDPAARAFTLAQPYSRYGYRKGQRYRAVNVLRELDCPGEWYLDRRTAMVYWLPPEGVDPINSETTISLLAEPFVTIEGAKFVTIRGFTLQHGRGDGIHIQGGANCQVAGCTIRRLGGDAIVVSGGHNHGLFGCTMHTLGHGGARIAGGDRTTLAAGGHFVENCTVYNISRLKRTYTPAVHMDGCGNRISHNLFERMPSSAMRIEGNDHIVELNIIRHVVEESDDQGGVDMFGNPLYRGVVIRWNRWSDIGGGTHCGAAGVRLDDMISGVTVQGNLFERCGAVKFGGIQIHGGKDNLIDGNVFVDCFAAVSFSHWSQQRWLESIGRFLEQATAPAYAARYPALARIKFDANVNFFCRNVFAGSEPAFLRDGGDQRAALNGTIPGSKIDLKRLSKASTAGKHTWLGKVLFEPIPLEDIGPYDHPWRASPDAD